MFSPEIFRVWRLVFLLLLTACGNSDPESSDQSIATFKVTFTATWDESTHPSDFPSNPHFSPLVGLTHTDKFFLWNDVEAVTDGFKEMAETGKTGPLVTEIETAISSGNAYAYVLASGPIAQSPGSIEVTFTASRDFPLLSLTSMIAPSPDWFVGIRNISLYSEGKWSEEITIDLYAYDAGTDSGESYTSQDIPTIPRKSVSKIETSPFENGEKLGTIQISKL